MNDNLLDELKNFRKTTNLITVLLIVSTFLSFSILKADQIGVSLLFLTIGFVLFLILDKKKVEFSQKEGSKKLCINNKLINLVFLLIFFTSLLTLIMHDSSIFRHVSFFICLALMFGTISIEMANIGRNLNNVRVASVLLKTMITELLYQWTFFRGISSLDGDVSLHMIRTESIIQDGTTANMLGYSDMPLYHILWAILTLVIGVDIPLSRFLMASIPALGVFFMYLFGRIFTEDKKASLYSALIFSFFTLTNRVKLQTESFVFPVLFLLLLYFSFRSGRKSYNDFVIIIILYLCLAYTHLYYSGLFVVWFALASLTSPIFQLIHKNRVLNKGLSILPFIGVFWSCRVAYSTMFEWPVKRSIDIISSLSLKTLGIEPAFLSAGTTTPQFLFIHLSELVLVSLSVVAVLLLLGRIDVRSSWMLGSFLSFSLITFVGVFVEGQKNLAWGVSFRNFYLISLFLVFLGGYALRNFELAVGRKRIIVIVFPVLFTLLSFFSVTSQQENSLDPLFYSGEVPSPKFISYTEIEILDNSFSYLPGNSTVLSDYRVLSHGNLVVPSGKNFRLKIFSEPSLPELNESYDYLIVSMYSIEKGMTFYGLVKGLSLDKENLLNKTYEMNGIWDAGPVRVYQKS